MTMICYICLVLLVCAIFKRALFLFIFSPFIYLYFRFKKKRKAENRLEDFSDHQRASFTQHIRNVANRWINGFSRYYLFLVSLYPSHHVRNFIYKKVCNIEMDVNVTIYSQVEFREPYKIKIGKGSIIGDGAILDGRNGIIIGENVNFSSNVSIWTEQHDHRDPYFRCSTQKKKSVVIGDRVWLGPNTIILHSVTIGEGAVVAAGAVVTKDVEPFSIVAGIPAKRIGERNRNLIYEMDGSYLPFL